MQKEIKANVDNWFNSLRLYGDFRRFKVYKKIRGPEPRPLLQATILFHLRGHLIKS